MKCSVITSFLALAAFGQAAALPQTAAVGTAEEGNGNSQLEAQEFDDDIVQSEGRVLDGLQDGAPSIPLGNLFLSSEGDVVLVSKRGAPASVPVPAGAPGEIRPQLVGNILKNVVKAGIKWPLKKIWNHKKKAWGKKKKGGKGGHYDDSDDSCSDSDGDHGHGHSHSHKHKGKKGWRRRSVEIDEDELIAIALERLAAEGLN